MTRNIVKALFYEILVDTKLLESFIRRVILVSFILLSTIAPDFARADSLLYYELRPENFPQELQSLVSRLGAQQPLASTQPGAVNHRELERIRNEAKQKLTQLSRGYSDELWFIIGLSSEALGELPQALEAYDKASQFSVRDPLPRFRHALLRKKQQEFRPALDELKEVLWQARASEHEVLFVMAECLHALGLDEEAKTHLERARAMNPQFAPALRLLVQTRMKLISTAQLPGEKLAAESLIIADLQALTAIEPNDRESQLQLTRMLLKSSDPLFDSAQLKRGQALATQVAEESKYKDETAVRLLFDIHLKLKDLKAAEDVALRGLKANPNSATLKDAQAQLAIETESVAKEKEILVR